MSGSSNERNGKVEEGVWEQMELPFDPPLVIEEVNPLVNQIKEIRDELAQLDRRLFEISQGLMK